MCSQAADAPTHVVPFSTTVRALQMHSEAILPSLEEKIVNLEQDYLKNP